MKLPTLFASVALIAASSQIDAATYYIDFDGGSDAAVGTSIGSAWKHYPHDVNATGIADATSLSAGDTVIFRAGVRYKGQFNVGFSGSAGNPITIKGTGWGTGKAIMDGSVLFTNTWTQCTSSGQVLGNASYANIWFADSTIASQTSLNTVIVSNAFLPFAQIVNPVSPILWDINSTWNTAPQANLLTAFTFSNSTVFTQSDAAFWTGAYAAFHHTPNTATLATITNFNPTLDTIGFDQSVTGPYSPLPYEIVGHPLHIDYMGEYAVKTNRMWLWPPGDTDPNTLSIYIGYLGGTIGAINIDGRNHVTIDGFEVTGYYGGLDITYSGGAFGNQGGGFYTGLKIINNDIKNCRSITGGGVIGYNNVNDGLVMNNSIASCLRSRGGIFHGTNIVVASNSWVDLGGTGIYFAGCVGSLIDSNYVYGIRGTHGNGISIYQDSLNVTNSRSYIDACGSPLTYELSSNIWHVASFIDCSYGAVNDWGGTGNTWWINSTILNMPGSTSALNVRPASGGWKVTVVNSMFDGLSYAYESNIVRRHNLWLDYDRGYTAPTMGVGESINTNWASIFVDTNAATANWRLLSSSPARGAGTNTSVFGIVMDMDGSTLSSTPDLGAWQYQGEVSIGAGVPALISPGGARKNGGGF